MRGFVSLLLLHSASAVIHSLKYFSTGSSGLSNLPEFVVVGELDGVQMVHYDSNTRRAEAKQDWMEELTAEDPDLWETQTQGFLAAQQIFRVSMESVRQRFNQTGGVHVLQKMFGCEWDDQTGEVDGFEQYAYDGEDFIAFDLKTQTWVAAKPQALITKRKWDKDSAWTGDVHHFLSQICPELVKKLLSYGRSSLQRAELPSVFLLQKTPSSPITCLATGFHPDGASLFWRRDGEELHEGVDVEETLPNHDGSFQRRAHLDPPSDDWQRYECVFQPSGVHLDVVARLDRAAVRFNTAAGARIPVFMVLAVLALLSLVTEGVFVLLRRRNRGKPCGRLDVAGWRSEKPPDYHEVGGRSERDSGRLAVIQPLTGGGPTRRLYENGSHQDQ